MRYDLLGEFTTVVSPYVTRPNHRPNHQSNQPVRPRRMTMRRWMGPAATVMLSSVLLAIF